MAKGGYRPNAGRRPGIKELKPRAKKKTKPGIVTSKPKAPKKQTIPQNIQDEATAENLTPLGYMLKIMNDPNEKDSIRKDRMAIAAAPFCHPRKGEGLGKKDLKDAAAKEAGKGRFSPGRAPIALVK